jgi:hypothetical protein
LITPNYFGTFDLKKMETATAKVFIQAFRSLPKKEKEAVKRWIKWEELSKGKKEEFEFWDGVSNDALQEIWGEEEDQIWDDIYAKTKE